MKTKILAIVSLFILSGCFSNAKTINGDGNIVENNVAVMNFDDIHIGINGCSTVTFQQSDNYSLTIITDQNIMPQLIVKNNGSKLNISSTRNTNLRPTQLTIIISSPNIEQADNHIKKNCIFARSKSKKYDCAGCPQTDSSFG